MATHSPNSISIPILFEIYTLIPNCSLIIASRRASSASSSKLLGLADVGVTVQTQDLTFIKKPGHAAYATQIKGTGSFNLYMLHTTVNLRLQLLIKMLSEYRTGQTIDETAMISLLPFLYLDDETLAFDNQGNPTTNLMKVITQPAYGKIEWPASRITIISV